MTNHHRGPIPTTIGRCGQLQRLSLSDNNFTGSIPTSINNLTMLKDFYLGSNRITGEISQELSNLPSLEVLTIERNGLFGHIPPFLFNISSLKLLSLWDNNLRGVIPEEVGNLSNLQDLLLEQNELSGPVPATIFNISTLRLLSLGYNNLSGNLPSTMGHKLPNLEVLNVASNNLSGMIPNFLSNSTMLTRLTLISNRFSGTIPNFGNLERLTHLSIGRNSLTSKLSSTGELTFLSSLTNCKHLRILWVGTNPLNGVLPASIGNLSTSLENIDATNCGIKGAIPDQIGNLSNLAFLALFDNELTGFIPTTIKSLQKLQSLYFENNRVLGFIPNDLCYLPKLGLLSLSENELTGPIPPCMGNISSLRYLYLGSNRLISSIPRTIWNLKNLLEFQSYSNSLSGNLPAEVGNLNAAIRIDLGINQFTGNIPSTIGSLKNLQSLRLDHNRFEGAIPESFGGMISLELLNLSQNNLSGVIPKSLEALLYLRYFNVSFNNLQGEIPSLGPFVNFTKQSFLANEALCGSPHFELLPCPSIGLPESRKNRVLLYVLLPIASILLAIIIAILFIRRRRRRKTPIENDLLPAITHERIAYHELIRATNDFNDSNKLGMGSFGSVYKGTLIDGMVVAIKVFNLQQEGAFKSFDIECEMLRNIRHRNLTKVISSCSNLDFKALVLEYMPNGNLDKWLYSHNYFLDMLQRLNIMIDVACALDYIHHGYSTPVVHCDLKPSNVLLDENMVAHVSDFGIAKFLDDEENSVRTKTLATFGYIAPEYGLEGSVSIRCDVYSYGILLMETFTRTKPTDDMFAGDLNLKGWVTGSSPNNIIQVIDGNLLRADDPNFNAKLHCVSAIMELALSCCAELPQDRINMKDALVALKKIKVKFLASQEGT